MAEEKVTTMKLKVDLQCCKCYKKVKKVLCKFPQIRDQVFNDKQGIVTIKVARCDPEVLRDDLCCKGGGCIRSIEIVEPPPPPKKTQPPPPILVSISCVCGRPPICCDGYYGWPVCDCYGWGRPFYVSRCDCDENPQGCTVM